MIKINKIYDLIPSGISYGGHSGSKSGILIDGERWFLKYPKSTKSMDNPKVSYTTSPISEYIGSHVYEIIGIDVHQTEVAVVNDKKVVVACKDFLNSSEVILDYNMLKNDYDEEVENELESLSSSSRYGHNDINEIELIMEKNAYFKKYPELKDRFWDMFIVDALISNNDRNEANWGLILDKDTKNIRLCPVFDNGASFYNKTNTLRFKEYLEDSIKFKQVVYDSEVSVFDDNGKNINPLKYIESMKNINCNEALLRIFPKINLDKIKEIIDNIPEEYQGLFVMSKEQKEFYYKSLEYRYNNVLKRVYEKLIK